MEAEEKRGFTVQELCDKLTELCHSGHAQAIVRHCTECQILDVKDVLLISDNAVMLTSKEVEK